MSNFLKIECKDREYLIGFSNRKAAINAEKRGLMKSIQNITTEPITAQANILLCGLLEKQPDITFERTLDILGEIQEQNIDMEDIFNFLAEQYTNFSSPQVSSKKKKKLQIVEM